VVLGIGLRVIPFSSGVAGFKGFRNGFCWASATVAVAPRTKTLRPISRMRLLDMGRLLSASPRGIHL